MLGLEWHPEYLLNHITNISSKNLLAFSTCLCELVKIFPDVRCVKPRQAKDLILANNVTVIPIVSKLLIP